VQTFKNVAANRIIEITEAKNEIVEKHYAMPGAVPSRDRKGAVAK
jgi:hypothetical protein